MPDRSFNKLEGISIILRNTITASIPSTVAQEVSLDQVEDATQELLSLLQQPREYAGTCSWQSWNGSHRQL